MNFSSLTGLLIFVGAVLWVGSFIPSWVKRGENVQEVRETRQMVTKQLRENRAAVPRGKQSSIAQQAISLGRRRRVIGSIAVVSGFIGLFALTDLTNLAAVAIGGLTLAAVSLVSSRALWRRQQVLLANSIQGRADISNNYRSMVRSAIDLAPQVAEAAADDRAWTPREIPAPLHTGHIGSLEQPTLAEVTQLPVAQPAVQSSGQKEIAKAEVENFGGANLDEILRRRRAV